MWRSSRNVFERSRAGYFWQPSVPLLPAISHTGSATTSGAFPITTVVDMDRASQVLAQGLPPDVPRTYAALAEQGDVPLSTLHHRDHGRRSREELAQSQQYLTPEEEKALVAFLLLISDLRQPV